MFDQSTRNRLQKFVAEARTLLSEEFTRQFQQDYGLDPSTGEVSALETLRHLDSTRLETARLLRDTLDHYRAGSPSGGAREALDRMVREQAFTILNRLCALRMAEARGILLESVGQGYQSKGFQLYARLAGAALGDTGGAYRSYLYSLFDEFAVDLAVLFDRYAPTGRLFPRETALLELLGKVNHPDLESLWAQDETIGWIYQYFNSQEERRQMRAESQAPRNSRELAVRNQFFTPRYVVEFLTDNTLGRIWYEMTKGQTALVHSCRYLVRRPTEIFLAPGEAAPVQPDETQAELSQEELLLQPVYILHRPIKDPRTLRMLDPACGSMHFGLYAFDLYERIYEEAWALEATQTLEREDADMPALRAAYRNDYEVFRRDVPRLILEYNIHGIDIDPRAAQIAGLSLWLRAQRAWLEQGVKAVERPRIERSNVVCAEPMPGEKDLLREFTAGLRPAVLGQLVEQIFEKMELAGEAGSLLKIEDEIAGAVDKARQAFEQELKVGRQGALFAEAEQARFDFTGLGRRTQFWEQAEERILEALRAYAEQAEGNTRRRLFARDAARGFAFIDVCRKRYDVVLMNPPFGETSKQAYKYLELIFPLSKSDLCLSFIDRAFSYLNTNGFIGSITSRTIFYLSSSANWRGHSLLKEGTIHTYADLGLNVMDSAMVEAASYVIEKKGSNRENLMPAFFVRLLKDPHKDILLENAVNFIGENFYYTKSEDFKTISGQPFSYWITNNVRNKISKSNTFEPAIGVVRVGTQSSNDERFVRLSWEVKISLIGKSIDDIDKGLGWIVFAKGGKFQRHINDFPLLINWFDDGREVKVYNSNTSTNQGHWSRNIRSIEYYFLPGFTWAMRSHSLGIHALPSGCIFSTNAYGAFINDGDLFAVLGFMASEPVDLLLKTYLERGGYSKFVPGIVQKTPIPDSTNKIKDDIFLSKNTMVICRLKQKIESLKEASNYFIAPLIYFNNNTNRLVEQFNSMSSLLQSWSNQIDKVEKEINSYCWELYGLNEKDISSLKVSLDESEIIIEEDEEVEDSYEIIIIEEITFNILQWCIGCIIGRWDIRKISDDVKAIDPFAPLPACPPGMLQNAQGLPAAPEDVPADYPLRLTWGGILVDDEGHAEDVVGRVREALVVIWGERAGDIEQEACDILGVKTLREYFRAPGKFFAEHLKRYSKSRRQAPIYWPLGTPSGGYTLWIYYHCLSDQTLYTAVNDFVEPKIRQVEQQLAALRTHSGRTKAEEKELETLTALDQELRGLRDELLRIAAFWKPNLNDGVVITAAPLWRLFQHKPWQKTLKETWQKLEKGDYDWAHLAYSIWPERVVKAARKDRSIAIAHDLEEALWVKTVDGKGKETWAVRELGEVEIKQITQNS